MVASCSVQHISRNNAQKKIEQASLEYSQRNAEYLACLPPQAQGEELLQVAKPAIDKVAKEAESIMYMERFILGQLKREVKHAQTVSTLSDAANEEADRIRKEIDEVKTEIRTEKRKFLDANPSASTAVAGLYFTRQPDNQLLIAFLSCLGAFLLFAGLLVIFDLIPLDYFRALSAEGGGNGQRVQIVLTAWLVIAITTYLGFFIFT